MRLLSALGLCLCGAATAAAQARRVELSDFQRFVTVSDPQIAPDGRSIVCVVSRVNWKDNRRDSDLLLVDVASGAQHSLTHDRRGVGSPRWSPTGDEPWLRNVTELPSDDGLMVTVVEPLPIRRS